MVSARKIVTLVLKDLRHVWPQLLAVLPLMFVFATSDLELLTRHATLLAATAWQLLFLATPLAIWSLVATVIHGEPLIGDRQYWLTRPFTWHHLAAAKLLVIVICINLPLFLFQAIALMESGISPVAQLHALFWRQVFFSAFVLFPAAAIAAVTRTQGQFALLILLAAGPFAGLVWVNGIPDSRWMQAAAGAAVLAVLSGAILVLQYARRRTAVSRTLLACMVLMCFGSTLVPWEAIFRPPASGTNIRLSLDRSVTQRGVESLSPYLNVAIELPLVAQGVPQNAELVLNDYRMALESPEIPGFRPVVDLVRLHGWDGYSGFLMIVLSPAEYRRLQGRAVTAKGWIAVTLMTRAEIRNTGPDTLHIAGFGVCTRSRKLCLSPEPRAALSLIRVPTEQRPDQYGRIVPLADTFPAFPTSPWLYPLETYHYEPTIGVLLVERPTAHFRFDLDFRDLQLSDFARPY